MRSRRVGPATFRRLIDEHAGDAEAALAALPGIARGAGIPSYTPCPKEAAAAELAAGRRLGAVPLFFDHPAYPAALRNVEDAPVLLWAQGDPQLAARLCIGLVGARNASSLGRRMARSLAHGLGTAGLVSVSGLARGIDGEVHYASLDTGTIAVVAGGIDVVYPREHAALMAEIARRGLVLSEHPPGLRPQARHFPRRNRIIAGLAQALVVVEAAPKSGSLITARDAADLGRDVMAVPGHPFDARASGCNLLIRDGATLVRGPGDVLSALGIAAPPKACAPAPSRAPAGRPLPVAPRPATSDSAARCAAPKGSKRGSKGGSTGGASHPSSAADSRATILGLLGPSPAEEDSLWRDTGLARPAFASSLTELELEGRIERLPGGRVARAP